VPDSKPKDKYVSTRVKREKPPKIAPVIFRDEEESE